MNEGNIRIREWSEFKRLITEKKPGSIVFMLEQNTLSPKREFTTLRMIVLHDKRCYIFIDFPKGESMGQTGIPLRIDKNGILNLEEDEI